VLAFSGCLVRASDVKPASTVVTPTVTSGPIFNTYIGGSTSQNILNGTWTKAGFTTTEYDSHGYVNLGTARFQPLISGYYMITANGVMNGSTGNNYVCSLWKSGAEYKRGSQSTVSPGGATEVSISTIVFLNGSTDYIEFYVYQGSGGTVQLLAGVNPQYTYMNGYMIRA
jgi:hypothetical protein